MRALLLLSLLGLSLVSAQTSAPGSGSDSGLPLPDPGTLAVLTCFASDPTIVEKLTDECQALVPLIPDILSGDCPSVLSHFVNVHTRSDAKNSLHAAHTAGAQNGELADTLGEQTFTPLCGASPLSFFVTSFASPLKLALKRILPSQLKLQASRAAQTA